jgi:predicted Zn-dependent peptidase
MEEINMEELISRVLKVEDLIDYQDGSVVSREIIRKETDDMKKGLFTDEDISVSKKSISTSIKSIVDSNYLISEFFLSQLLTGDNRTIDEMISDIEKVSKDKVVEASNKLNLDTIYFLSNKKISQ